MCAQGRVKRRDAGLSMEQAGGWTNRWSRNGRGNDRGRFGFDFDDDDDDDAQDVRICDCVGRCSC